MENSIMNPFSSFSVFSLSCHKKYVLNIDDDDGGEISHFHVLWIFHHPIPNHSQFAIHISSSHNALSIFLLVLLFHFTLIFYIFHSVHFVYRWCGTRTLSYSIQQIDVQWIHVETDTCSLLEMFYHQTLEITGKNEWWNSKNFQSQKKNQSKSIETFTRWR